MGSENINKPHQVNGPRPVLWLPLSCRKPFWRELTPTTPPATPCSLLLSHLQRLSFEFCISPTSPAHPSSGALSAGSFEINMPQKQTNNPEEQQEELENGEVPATQRQSQSQSESESESEPESQSRRIRSGGTAEQTTR